MNKIIKRDGAVVDFDSGRIYRSVQKATDMTGEKVNIGMITDEILDELRQLYKDRKDEPIKITEIADTTEHILIKNNYYKTYNEFRNYRIERTKIREANSNLAKTIKEICIETDRDNANVGNNFSAKLLRIGSEASKWYATTALLPKDEVKMHENGEIYDQDLDSINLTINCLHIPTKRILDRGFNPGYGLIKKPNGIETAAMLSCILLQSSQNDMFGGQSHPNFDNDMSEYVMLTRKKETAKYLINKFVEISECCINVSFIADIIQEDVTNWSDNSIKKLEDTLTNNEVQTCHLKEYYNISNESSEELVKELINTARSIVDKANVIKEYLKEIPSSTEKQYWSELIEKIDSGDFSEKTGVTCNVTGMKIRAMIEPKVYRSVRQAMQTVVYNLNTMHSRAGAQVPFSTVNIGIPENSDAALVCEVFLDEYVKGLGKGEQPIFPNIIFRVKKGVNRDPLDPYFYLFKKACDVAAVRMNPTFMNLDSNYYKPFYDRGIIGSIMGCRTAVCANVNGKEGPEGRGNIAPATINLVRIGLQAMHNYPNPDDKEKRIEYFFNLLDIRLKACVQKLMTRYNILKKLRVADIPFSIGQGLMQGNEDMKLNAEDSIQPILEQGTWAIGFIGIAETLVCLTGKHQGESAESQELGLKIVKTIREYADKQTEEKHLNFGCYATPAEGLCGKLVKIDRKRFGVIEGVTDKDYYTNSYHVPVNYKISIMDKMRIEAPYQYYCNSGCISYIEFDGEPSGSTLMKVVTKTFEELPDMNYMAGNFHKRTCKDCGCNIYTSEQKCPKCGSRRIQGVSRVTGYLGLDERFGAGKAAEKKDRVSHTI